MRILVYGAGAVGSLLGGFLASDGHDVTLLARSEHVEAVRRDGLSISGVCGEHVVSQIRAVESLEALKPTERFDWIFITVKTYDTLAAAQAVASLAGNKTFVCSVQNGLGNLEKLRTIFKAEQVALGRIITGVTFSPGKVRATVTAGPLRLGVAELDRGPVSAVRSLVQTFKAAGLECLYSEKIIIDLWAKVLYNCALNGLATVLDGPYGILLETATTRRLMQQIVEEAYAVAESQGLQLEPKTAHVYNKKLLTQLLPDTAAHYPSMHADIRRGKPTEIKAMNGTIERLGLQCGIPTPQNALVTRLVRAQERFCNIPSRD